MQEGPDCSPRSTRRCSRCRSTCRRRTSSGRKAKSRNQEVQLEDAKKQLERTQQLFDKRLANQQPLDQADPDGQDARRRRSTSAKKQLLTSAGQPEPGQAERAATPKIYVADRRRRRQPHGRRGPDGAGEHDGAAVLHARDRPATAEAARPAWTKRKSARFGAGMPVDVHASTRIRARSVLRHRRRGAAERARTASNVVTYPVWIDVPNPDLRLRPAMTANVDDHRRGDDERRCASRIRRCGSGRRPTCTRRSA